MRTSISKNKFSAAFLENWGIKILILFCWLLLWHILYVIVGQEILLVSPVQVFWRLGQLIFEPYFWSAILFSLLRIMFGFLLAMFLGAVLAWLCFWQKLIYQFIQPVLTIIKATPVASFIILILIWVDVDTLSVFISFLMVLPMAWSNIYQGIIHTDDQLLEMATVFDFSFLKKLKLVYIPSIMPYFVVACTTGIGFAWKAGVAAEVLGIPSGSIGYYIYNAKVLLETGDLFAWTMVVILLSLIIEKVFIGLLKKVNQKIIIKE